MNVDPFSLERRQVVAQLLQARGDLIVVTGLGSTAYDLASVGDSPLDFPLWGAMGGAAMIGLGLALAQPERRILVLTGDGEMLMGLGSLATIAAQKPRNLSIVVMNNARYGETGLQRTHTALGADLTAIARGCGFEHTRAVKHAAEVNALRTEIFSLNQLLFADVHIVPQELPRVLPPRDGVYLAYRVRAAILGKARALEA